MQGLLIRMMILIITPFPKDTNAISFFKKFYNQIKTTFRPFKIWLLDLLNICIIYLPPPQIILLQVLLKIEFKIHIKFKTSNLNAIQTKSDIKISKILIF